MARAMGRWKGAAVLALALVSGSSLLWPQSFAANTGFGAEGGATLGTLILCVGMAAIYGFSWQQGQALRAAESQLPETTGEVAKKPRIGALDSLRFILIAYIASGHFIHTATKNPFLLRMITQINVVVGAFFVISGYVAAYTTTELGQRKGSKRLDNAVEFVVTRIMGHWPLHLIVLLLFSPMFLYVDVSYSGWPTALWNGFISTFMLQAWFPTSGEVWNAPTWFLSALSFALCALPYSLRVLATQKKEELRRTLVILTLLSLIPKVAYSSDLHAWGIMEGMLNAKTHPNYAVFNTRVAREAATADLDLDLMLTSPPGSGLSRYKGTGFDPEACGEACEALAEAIAKGNQQQVESLICALKLMMPPSSGAEQALGPPRDNFILRPEELDWSEQDFLGGLWAATVATADAVDAISPDVRKNYALDKADALYEITKPHCLSRGLPWNVKWFQDCATLRCKQNRQAEAAPMLEEVAKLTPPHEATLRTASGVLFGEDQRYWWDLREHDKAKVYFDAAAELVGERDSNGKLILDKEDLWNIGLVHKNKKNYAEAAPMLDQALEKSK
eukprot:g9276.t1